MARVSPMDKAMSLFAPRKVAAVARWRWARPDMRPMLPKKGRPLGPGITADVVEEFAFLHRYFPQAGPPGEAQWRRELANHARIARMTMEERVSPIEGDKPPKKFGARVKGRIHQLSTEVSMIGRARKALIWKSLELSFCVSDPVETLLFVGQIMEVREKFQPGSYLSGVVY